MSAREVWLKRLMGIVLLLNGTAVLLGRRVAGSKISFAYTGLPAGSVVIGAVGMP